MISTNSLFFNESEISFKFDWRSSSELPPDVNVQVGNLNLELNRSDCTVYLEIGGFIREKKIV